MIGYAGIIRYSLVQAGSIEPNVACIANGWEYEL
jgi:hypothetical protein